MNGTLFQRMSDRRQGLGPTEPAPRAARTSTLPPGIRPGLVLDDTYHLRRVLGEGAMGVVYLAEDQNLQREVAIKFIQPDLVRSEDAHQRFLLEARTMARIKHVNVVDVYAYGELMSSPYFVMEYVPGTNVGDWARLHRGALAIDEIVGVVDQICRGVAAVHRAGAVHRDLKPGNVLIGPAFRVCVTDLGLVKVLDKAVRDELKDTVSGTPAYMAPEVVLGTPIPKDLESRADVYALGVMTFELCVGRLPFEHDDPTDMMLAHVDDKPPTPSELRHDLPASFDAVLLDALVKDPYHRIPSAEAFRRRLLEARESASTSQKNLRFIIADDDDDFRTLVAETLIHAFPGAEIESYARGAEALKAADRGPATLALVDLDMPDMNGVELTAALRATPHARAMPILVATARGGAPDWRLLQTLGADGFMVKPIDPVSLIAMARRAIETRRPQR